MSRMLKALQTIEERGLPKAVRAAAPPAVLPESLATVEELLGAIGDELASALPPAWTDSTAFPTLQVWQSPMAVHMAETALYQPPPGAPPAAAEVVADETAPDIAPQYRDLAADLAETWDLPMAVTLAGASAGRGHEVVGLMLAAAMQSLLKTRVLVIDGDFRDPAVAAHDAEPDAPRLRDVMAGQADCRELAAATIYPGVDVLSGHWNEEEDGLLQQRADFMRLIRACKKAYRVVLVMAPPLDYPETPLLAAACDGTYLVVRLGHVTPRSLRQVTTALESRGAALLGCISLTDQ